MALFKIVVTAGLLSLAAGFVVPSANGFPNPNPDQMKAIAQQAGGLLPPGPLPTSIGDGSATAWQLIAFNELFETAYFNTILSNITNNVTGYAGGDRDALIKTFTAVTAQEEQHALGAITVLKTAGRFAPMPCQYQAPVTNLEEAINVAETFTAVVLGALQGANTIFSADNKTAFVQLVSSVIGQEGEQNGYYRSLLQRIPSESPFLTFVPAPFAFSALQLFVVPGSCPYPLSNINLPIFPPIMTNGGPVAVIQPQDQTLNFQTDVGSNPKAQAYVGGKGRGLYMTYTTGQQNPISIPITNVRWSGTSISFSAFFPYNEYVMHGFSHGALTTTCNFTSPADVPNAALAAPAVIQVNNAL